VSDAASLPATLRAAEEVLAAIREMGTDALLIGALALAVHGYPRATEDLDLAVATPVANLRALARVLRERGYDVTLREPDADDPLGGVLDVRMQGADLIQVVNFDNSPGGGFPRLVSDALTASEPLAVGSTLRVADPYHLIAFKLYAGGPKSGLDILALLERNPDLDLERLRRLCAGYRLDRALDRLLALADALARE
jgi:hypothetical protein